LAVDDKPRTVVRQVELLLFCLFESAGHDIACHRETVVVVHLQIRVRDRGVGRGPNALEQRRRIGEVIA
jgi:hypothetical protein